MVYKGLPQMQVCGRDGPDAPLCLGAELLRLVVGRRRRDDLVTVFVHGPGGERKDRKLILLKETVSFANLLSSFFEICKSVVA